MKSQISLSFIIVISLLAGDAFGQAKIVGGTDTPLGTYRWMAAIARKGGGNLATRRFCGGSLIHPNWVLTAAHCVEDLSHESIEVVVGARDLRELGGAQVRQVRGIYIHPGYQDVDDNLFSDMALLLLDAPVVGIAPIEYAASAGAAPPGTVVRALGWGTSANILQMVDLSIVPLRVANRAYGINRLDSRHLAAMSPGRDTCQGDSGGPLFDVDGASGAPLLVGVTSYGKGCALRDIPGIYANVGYFKSWLDLFLSQPVALDPDISVTGNGLDLPNGSTSVSVLNGTDYGRRLRGGRYARRTFIISNAAGTAPLSLLQIGSSLDSFDVIGAPRYVLGGSLASFQVRWRAPYSSKRGKATAEVSILSNDLTDDEYTFTLMGKYRKSRAF